MLGQRRGAGVIRSTGSISGRLLLLDEFCKNVRTSTLMNTAHREAEAYDSVGDV